MKKLSATAMSHSAAATRASSSRHASWVTGSRCVSSSSSTSRTPSPTHRECPRPSPTWPGSKQPAAFAALSESHAAKPAWIPGKPATYPSAGPCTTTAPPPLLWPRPAAAAPLSACLPRLPFRPQLPKSRSTRKSAPPSFPPRFQTRWPSTCYRSPWTSTTPNCASVSTLFSSPQHWPLAYA